MWITLNSALIKDNELTLIGRVTNPQEQRIWALIPALPRKWHLQGRVSESDLGNGCFQYRFEKEEDLKRVLDNRPYHFAYWMVILQRWEPVISATFPSQIPFWIRVKGLPLHFWHEDMLRDISKDLGTLKNHELTKITARIQVLVDGLKPLIKKAIVEFDSGEESLISLEYERLEYHCSICNRLSHLKQDCPQNLGTTHHNHHLLKDSSTGKGERHASEARILPYESRDQALTQTSQGAALPPPRPSREAPETTRNPKPFHNRVDRHGNSFGSRVGTKQTRAPPPSNSSALTKDRTDTWRGTSRTFEPEPPIYASPPYTIRRGQATVKENSRREPSHQREFKEWRKKTIRLGSPY